MKKTYINPEVEVVEVQMAQAMMDAISGPSISNDDDEVTDVGDLLNREFGSGLWD